LLSPGALTVDRQSAPIARWNAAGSLSAFNAMTIIRRTDVQGSPSRAISGLKTEQKQRSFSYRHRCSLQRSRHLVDLTPLETPPTPWLSLTRLDFHHSILAHDRPDHLTLPHR
jgi:hypothetical protein